MHTISAGPAPATVRRRNPGDEPDTGSDNRSDTGPGTERDNELTRALTRILTLADGDHGELLAQPSPVPHERVLVAYHLPAAQPDADAEAVGQGGGCRGDHRDTAAIRIALLGRLVTLGELTPRRLPGAEILDVHPVTLAPAGRAWLAEHAVPDVTVALTPLSPDILTRPRHAGHWADASWRGTGWPR